MFGASSSSRLVLLGTTSSSCSKRIVAAKGYATDAASATPSATPKAIHSSPEPAIKTNTLPNLGSVGHCSVEDVRWMEERLPGREDAGMPSSCAMTIWSRRGD